MPATTQDHRCAFCKTVIERLPSEPGIPINCANPVCKFKARSALESLGRKGVTCMGCGRHYEKGHVCPAERPEPTILFADVNFDCQLYIGSRAAMDHLRKEEGGAPYEVDPSTCIEADDGAIEFDLNMYGNTSRRCTACILYAAEHWYV